MPAQDVHETAVARYFEAWNATGADDVRKAVEAAWTQDAAYTDPLADAAGTEALVAVIAAAQKQFPGFEFRRTGEVDGHHGIVRFSWELVSGADGSAPVAGSDVAVLAEDGRIRRVYGFLDRLPQA
ncbi:nuclear transport factor 2 family protein [Streptomyces sp. AN091965]|uniref:nuclear transport factor 2 family protein n=1 Tax=Streptomyces sp. AN091965 TaxID=2927803 RepID=UPI001F60DEF9|nr:nuclear transport factor 2 family protein [Streptomyces sp. AN091965]MCI3931936.1 nuclear transport factor 2 family protein [Streptomyces sp. AN091965]